MSTGFRIGLALDRALERLRQQQSLVDTPTLSEFVELYLAQHDAEPETIAKLRWPLGKATAAFGELPLSERQTLQRAVSWAMLNSNPAKQGVENRQRPRVEQRPFDSWEQIRAVADRIGARYRPLVLFAAATGLRPSEWIALEHRDIGREARIVYVRRAYRNGRLKCPKTDGSDRVPISHGSRLAFPAPCGGYLDLHSFHHRDWKPAQRTLGIDPIRRVYDLRHTFATFALRAGISTFDLSR